MNSRAVERHETAASSGAPLRAHSHASFQSVASSDTFGGRGEAGASRNRQWAVEPLLTNAPQLLINDKPLEEFGPLGQPDSAGRLGVNMLLSVSFLDGLAWGSTVGLLGRLSLLSDPDGKWRRSGTSPLALPPVAAGCWGVALLICAPIGGVLVDFRFRNMRVQLAAILSWAVGSILLLWASLTSDAGSEASAPPKILAILCGIGAALSAGGVAVLRPLLSVLLADQVREPECRAQTIGLCFLCFTAGDLAASIVDAAGASAVALSVMLLCVLVAAACGLFAIRKVVDLGREPINPTAGLWDEFMPSGHGGSSEWSDDSLLSENGETVFGWCQWCMMVVRRCRRHPLFCCFGGYIEGRHARALVKVMVLAALVRSSQNCVDWGDQAALMEPQLCFGGAGVEGDDTLPYPPLDTADAARAEDTSRRHLLMQQQWSGGMTTWVTRQRTEENLQGVELSLEWDLDAGRAVTRNTVAIMQAPIVLLAETAPVGKLGFQAINDQSEGQKTGLQGSSSSISRGHEYLTQKNRMELGGTAQNNTDGGSDIPKAPACLDVGHDAVSCFLALIAVFARLDFLLFLEAQGKPKSSMILMGWSSSDDFSPRCGLPGCNRRRNHGPARCIECMSEQPRRLLLVQTNRRSVSAPPQMQSWTWTAQCCGCFSSCAKVVHQHRALSR